MLASFEILPKKCIVCILLFLSRTCFCKMLTFNIFLAFHQDVAAGEVVTMTGEEALDVTVTVIVAAWVVVVVVGRGMDTATEMDMVRHKCLEEMTSLEAEAAAAMLWPMGRVLDRLGSTGHLH